MPVSSGTKVSSYYKTIKKSKIVTFDLNNEIYICFVRFYKSIKKS